MEKIESFKVDHKRLLRGIYLSRLDYDNKTGEVMATTFDIRMKLPNREPVLNTAECHAIEHLGASFLRNHEKYKNETIYFGPMGCRTGYYLLLKGKLEPKDIVKMVTDLFEFILKYEGTVPGADEFSCGNYLDHNLTIAKYESKKFLDEVLYVIKEENMVYPA